MGIENPFSRSLTLENPVVWRQHFLSLLACREQPTTGSLKVSSLLCVSCCINEMECPLGLSRLPCLVVDSMVLCPFYHLFLLDLSWILCQEIFNVFISITIIEAIGCVRASSSLSNMLELASHVLAFSKCWIMGELPHISIHFPTQLYIWPLV